jgi:hypothetical protein
LSEQVDAHCQLRVNIVVLIVVIMCNILEIGVLTAIFWTLPQEILATVGDAASSFLTVSDRTTSKCSLLTREDVINHRGPPEHFPQTLVHRLPSSPLGSAASSLRWAVSIVFCIAVWITAIGFLVHGISRLKSSTADVYAMAPPTNATNLARMGFGTVNTNTLVAIANESSPSNTFVHVLLVNTPQFVLSLSYFAYNGLWSCMLLMREGSCTLPVLSIAGFWRILFLYCFV